MNTYMNELIFRALKGRASEEEGQALRVWREAAPGNEQQYREVVSLLMESEEAVWEVMVDDDPPPVEVILSLASRSPGRSGARHQPSRRPVSRRVLFGAAGIMAAAASLLLVVRLPLAILPPAGGEANPAAFGPREIVTGPAETTIVRLGDGTVIRLGPESRLLVPEIAGPEGARQVWLSGRAFFAVTRDEDGRPFIVRSHAGDATVLGTRFDLTVADDDLRALVVEGLVRLEVQGEEPGQVEVGASQVGLVSPLRAPERADVDEETIDRELDWLGNYLVFEATPLRQVARELERRYGVPVRILDPALESETVRGVFLNEDLEDVTNVICRALSVHCISRTSGVTFGL